MKQIWSLNILWIQRFWYYFNFFIFIFQLFLQILNFLNFIRIIFTKIFIANTLILWINNFFFTAFRLTFFNGNMIYWIVLRIIFFMRINFFSIFLSIIFILSKSIRVTCIDPFSDFWFIIFNFFINRIIDIKIVVNNYWLKLFFFYILIF